jgi:DNA (cytosine-5)-methyltransferase 1
MRVLDLFSGIGGFSLGLERAGFETVAFCEIDKKCHKVLQKHWPNVPIFEDVCTLTKEVLDERGISVDVICGGFPCQDISLAGKGAGIEGERSGLWREYARIISELRPKFVIVENVSALLSRGLDRVLGDLAEIGYDAEWHCIPASAVGAPHRRDRIWIVAYSRRFAPQIPFARQLASVKVSERNGWWAVEPDVGRVAHGVPNRLDRLKQLGNAVVPQIPELIGKAIMSC